MYPVYTLDRHRVMLREGVAILLHLLNKHENSMLPTSGAPRQQAIQDIMFANATMLFSMSPPKAISAIAAKLPHGFLFPC